MSFYSLFNFVLHGKWPAKTFQKIPKIRDFEKFGVLSSFMFLLFDGKWPAIKKKKCGDKWEVPTFRIARVTSLLEKKD